MVNKSINNARRPGQVRQNKSSRFRNNNSIPNPPEWSPNKIQTIKQRYQVSTAVTNRSIGAPNLLDSLFTATDATSGYRTLVGAKILSVKIWAANSMSTPNSYIAVEWASTNSSVGSNSVTHSDIALGMTNIAHVSSTPPKGSYGEMWLTNVDYEVFNVTCPAGSILDVTYQGSYITDEPAASVQRGVLSAIPGTYYVSSLDCDNATPVIIPIGVNTI